MSIDINELLVTISIWALPVLFAITLHEVAHGWMARRLGDNTAYMLGRLSLNPIKHIDPIGTVLVPLVLLALGGFIFGWAKPVPVNSRNLHNPQKDMAIVAVAGPLANLAMALGWAILWKIGAMFGTDSFFGAPMIAMAQAGILINLILMILNLLPLPPLDGGRVVSGFLPARLADQYDRIEPFGFFILIALLALGILGQIIYPILNAVYALIISLFSLPLV